MKKQIEELLYNFIIGEYKFLEIEESDYDHCRKCCIIDSQVNSIWGRNTKKTNKEYYTKFIYNNLFDGFITPDNRSTITYVQDVDDNIKLYYQIRKYETETKFNIIVEYYNTYFNIYQAKNYQGKNEIDCFDNYDLYKMIDFSKFNETTKQFSLNNNNYVYIAKISENGLLDLFKNIIIKNDTLEFNDRFYYIFGTSNDLEYFNEKILKDLKVKKIISHTDFDLSRIFDDFSTIQTIELSNKIKKSDIEYTLIKMLNIPNVLDMVDKKYHSFLTEYDEFNKLESKYNNSFVLKFDYKGLVGYVHTNEFEFDQCKNHYEKNKNIKLSVAGLNFELTNKEFFESISKYTKKISGKKLDAAYEYYGSTVGYTDWWLKDFCKRPKVPKLNKKLI